MNVKSLIGLLAFTAALSAHATPGDIGCTGTLGGRVALEVLIGYDNHGQINPSLLELTARGEKIFSSASPRWTMENVGTEDEPFMNSVLKAESGGSYVSIRFPEQDPEADTTEAIMEFAISGGLKANYVEITCTN